MVTEVNAESPVVTALSPVAAIRRYFFAPDAKAGDVLAEIRALTDEDKRELAEGAARELGVTLSS